ncbi:MAG: hypothetical protein R3223_12920 [Longimicrobiales bacterium]|nr:hypothetical protein [Longimicrobiales bacterium]
MGYRTNADRILENIDRSRSREDESPSDDRQATGRELDTQVPGPDATTPERVKRVFRAVERAYMKAAQREELGRLAARFRSIGDISHHHARGDVSVSVRYLDDSRADDVGITPFEVRPSAIEEAAEESGSRRADVNALRVLRQELRSGVLAAYDKIESRVREAVRDRADMGHLEVRVTIDLRPAE